MSDPLGRHSHICEKCQGKGCDICKGIGFIVEDYNGEEQMKKENKIKINQTLQEVIGKLLTKKKKTLAIAESCSGGLISNLITNVAGSSKYFMGGIVAYNNKFKINLLGVEKRLINTKGIVSKEVALSLAKNIHSLARTDFGLGVTGTVGTKKNPFGIVYIALSTKKKTVVKKFYFIGTREEIKFQTAQQALNLLRLNLIKNIRERK